MSNYMFQQGVRRIVQVILLVANTTNYHNNHASASSVFKSDSISVV